MDLRTALVTLACDEEWGVSASPSSVVPAYTYGGSHAKLRSFLVVTVVRVSTPPSQPFAPGALAQGGNPWPTGAPYLGLPKKTVALSGAQPPFRRMLKAWGNT